MKIETLVLAFFLQTLLFKWKSEEEDKYQLQRGLLRGLLLSTTLANEISQKLVGGLQLLLGISM